MQSPPTKATLSAQWTFQKAAGAIVRQALLLAVLIQIKVFPWEDWHTFVFPFINAWFYVHFRLSFFPYVLPPVAGHFGVAPPLLKILNVPEGSKCLGIPALRNHIVAELPPIPKFHLPQALLTIFHKFCKPELAILGKIRMTHFWCFPHRHCLIGELTEEWGQEVMYYMHHFSPQLVLKA